MTRSTLTLKSTTLSVLMAGLVLTSFSTARSIQDHGDHGDHGAAAGQATAKAEFAGDPYLLGTDAVSGKPLGALDKQVILKHEGREFRFAGEKTAAMFHANPGKYLPAVDKRMIEQQLSFYPLDTCPVTGEKLGGMGKPIDVIYKNRLVRLCCAGCKKTLAKDSGEVMAKLDKAVIAAQSKAYPLKTCVVTGDELGAMGAPIDYVVGNRLVRLCCKGCKKKVAKDPIAFLAKLDAESTPKMDHDKMDHGGAGEHGTHGG